MARPRKLAVGALNIRLHPHPAGIYERYLRELYRLKRSVKLRGDRRAIIRSLAHEPDEFGFINGVMSTFLRIDMNQPWFNEETFDEATEEDLEKVLIPRELHPNVKSFLFALDPVKHRIYFETYNGDALSPKMAKLFFDSLSEFQEIKAEFGEAKISIIQDHASLAEIFRISRITEVKVFIAKPNDIWPDDFEQHLGSKNAKSMTLEYRADSGEGIQVDEDLQKITESSLDNGYTEVAGYSEQGHVRRSTKDFPKIVQDRIEQGLESAVAMFKSVVRKY